MARMEALGSRFSRLLEEPAFKRPEAPLEILAQRVDALYDRMAREAEHQGQMKWVLLDGMAPRMRAISPKEKLEVSMLSLKDRARRLRAAHALFMGRRMDALKAASERLELVSPLAVLARGYSLVYRESDGSVIKNSERVKERESIRIRLSEGGLLCRVEKVFPEGGRS